MSQAKNLRAVGDRIDSLLEEFAAVADPRTREKAEELIRLLMEFYGGGLARILEIIDQTDVAAPVLFGRFADDDLVASLLILHGLHPLPVEARIARGLERVRPYLGSHGGDVKLIGVTDGVVHLRLEGSCDGCPSSTITMKLAVERAIEEAAPEVSRIEVEGTGEPTPGNSFSEEAVPTNGGATTGEWIALDKMPDFASSGVAATELRGMKIVLCRVGDILYAYDNSCPSCGGAFDASVLRDEILICASCKRGYDVRRAGQCSEASELHLMPLPLISEQGAVKIAVPKMSARPEAR
jgi:Fe-S cluster biogenesis protein NfuA/nitrite reductase/ring-hydroxylating ferredoxin subunit